MTHTEEFIQMTPPEVEDFFGWFSLVLDEVRVKNKFKGDLNLELALSLYDEDLSPLKASTILIHNSRSNKS